MSTSIQTGVPGAVLETYCDGEGRVAALLSANRAGLDADDLRAIANALRYAADKLDKHEAERLKRAGYPSVTTLTD